MFENEHILDSRHKISKKGLKLNKKIENDWKQVFQAFGCKEHPKAGQNKQQMVAVGVGQTALRKSFK